MAPSEHVSTEAVFTPSIEQQRRSRRILPFISDYLPDQKDMPFDDRVAYYRMLREELGVHTVRTEFRMRHMIHPDGKFDQKTIESYLSALRAMKEAGLSAPIIYLFSPAPWMIESAKKNPENFYELFRTHSQKVKEIYEQAQFIPLYIQVLSEVNVAFHTPLSIDQVAECIKIARDVFRSGEGPHPKIMTTVFAGKNVKNDWQKFVVTLMGKAGSHLDALGFDYYPGSYENPAGIPLLGKKPYEAFAGRTPYEWIANEKAHGILKGKDVILAETGVPAMSHESKFARFGYDRIVQTLDHFLIDQERKGNKSNEILSAVGFFTGGEFPAVHTMAPGGIDFHPWTLVRRQNDKWMPTNAARRLKHLIESRLYPEKS